jgi:hypothetical protein
MSGDSVLRALVDLRQQIQKTRIRFSNRLSALEDGSDTDPNSGQYEELEQWYETFDALEVRLDKQVAAKVKDWPIYPYITAVRGIGPMLAAKVVSLVDIERANTVSALWRYAGFAVINGERERPVKGERLHYNKRLKTACYLVALSFLRQGSPYRRIYDSAKEYYQANRDWTKGHIHMASLRKMTKVFLAHCWFYWRTLEGLPTRPLYVHEKLGHEHVHQATDFGWPELEIVEVTGE